MKIKLVLDTRQKLAQLCCVPFLLLLLLLFIRLLLLLYYLFCTLLHKRLSPRIQWKKNACIGSVLLSTDFCLVISVGGEELVGSSSRIGDYLFMSARTFS